MTAHPIDRDRLDRLVDQHGPDRHGPDHCGDRDCFTSCVWCDEEWPCPTVDLARLLAAAEARATRAEAQSAIRGRTIAYARKRAREADARIKAVRDVLDGVILRDGTEEKELAHRIRRALEG